MKYLINFSSKLVIDFFAKLISLITLPIIARGLGPDGFGEFIFINVVSSYFGLFIDFGYFLYATNYLSKFPEQFETIVNKVLSVRLLSAIASYLLVLSSYFFFDLKIFTYLILYSLIFFTQVFKIDFYHISFKRLYYNSFSEIMGQSFFLLGVILLFPSFKNITVLIFLVLLQSLITASISLYPFLKNAKLRLNLSLSTFLEIFKNSYKLGFSQKFEFITSSSVILLIGFLLSKEDIGYFSAAFKIYSFLIIVVSGISYTFMADIFNSTKTESNINQSKLNILFYVYLISGFIIGSIVIFFSPQIIKIFFGNNFDLSIVILNSLGYTLFLWPIIMFIGLIFISFNKQVDYLKTTIFTASITIIFTYILIKLLGFQGVSLIFPLVSLCSLSVSLFLLFKILREKNIKMGEFFSFLNFVKYLITLVIRNKK